MTNKIITISTLINAYYKMCDEPKKYMDLSPSEIVTQRQSLVNVIYNIIHGRFPNGSDSFTLLRVLNNDISGKRLTPEQIIARFKIKP